MGPKEKGLQGKIRLYTQVYIGGWTDTPKSKCVADVKEIKLSDNTTETLTAGDFLDGAKELEFTETNDINVSYFTFTYAKKICDRDETRDKSLLSNPYIFPWKIPKNSKKSWNIPIKPKFQFTPRDERCLLKTEKSQTATPSDF